MGQETEEKNNCFWGDGDFGFGHVKFEVLAVCPYVTVGNMTWESRVRGADLVYFLWVCSGGGMVAG